MPNGVQTVARAASGRWVLTIKGLPAGTFVGGLNFTDITGTHAANQIPVSFTVSQGPTPSPTPSPTKTATPKPPTDGCAGQIRI